jgi:hypothetical protein
VLEYQSIVDGTEDCPPFGVVYAAVEKEIIAKGRINRVEVFDRSSYALDRDAFKKASLVGLEDSDSNPLISAKQWNLFFSSDTQNLSFFQEHASLGFNALYGTEYVRELASFKVADEILDNLSVNGFMNKLGRSWFYSNTLDLKMKEFIQERVDKSAGDVLLFREMMRSLRLGVVGGDADETFATALKDIIKRFVEMHALESVNNVFT